MWRKIEYQKGGNATELPVSGEWILIYNEADDRIVAGYLWRGDNPRDHNPDGSYLAWLPIEELYLPRKWNPTHWMPWPQRPEEVENVSKSR